MNLVVGEKEEIRIQNILNIIENGGFNIEELLNAIDSLSNIEDKYFLTAKVFLFNEYGENLTLFKNTNKVFGFYNEFLAIQPEFYLNLFYDFKNVHKLLKNDFSIAFLGVQLDPDNFNHVSDNLKNDFDFISQLIKDFPEIKSFLPEKFKSMFFDL